MEVDFAFLCDYADAVGKLNALGIGIDTLYLPEVPGLHNGFFAVLRLRFLSTESGTKDVKVCILGPDGENVVPPFQGTLSVDVRGATTHATQMVFRFQPLRFEKYGPYSVRWVVQGIEVDSLYFNVAPPPEAA